MGSFAISRRWGRKAVRTLGELAMTAGVLLLLFIAWEFWWTNVESGAAQGQAIEAFAKDFHGPFTPSESEDYGKPKVSPAPGYGTMIGIIYIPRFGKDYSRPVIEGTGADILDSLGVGHYQSTAMPGAVGNFAVAGHRQTHGAVFDNIDQLLPGDRIYVQTRLGYYTYAYRDSEIVLPSRSDVLLPVPGRPGIAPSERYLTMTSCHPRFGSEKRIIAFSVLKGWRPASAGPPREIAAQVGKALGRA